MQTRDFTHVSDIVQAIGLALQADCPSDTYNVGTGVQTSILELAHLLARELSFTGPIGPTARPAPATAFTASATSPGSARCWDTVPEWRWQKEWEIS